MGCISFAGVKKKNIDKLERETLQLLALLTTEEMMCSIIQGSSTTDPFTTEWSFSAFNRWSSLREMLMKTFHEYPRVRYVKEILAKIAQECTIKCANDFTSGASRCYRCIRSTLMKEKKYIK